MYSRNAAQGTGLTTLVPLYSAAELNKVETIINSIAFCIALGSTQLMHFHKQFMVILLYPRKLVGCYLSN